MNRRVNSWELRLQQGDVKGVARDVQSLTVSDLPRKYHARMANIFRRIQRPDLSIRLMGTLMRERVEQARETEVVEYAMALMHFDLHREAEMRLRNVDSRKFPQVLMFRAAKLAREWNYPGLVLVLNQYLKSIEGPYQIAVGEINLAAAHVALKNLDEARGILDEVEHKSSDWHRILSNIHEIRAQIEIEQGRFSQAREQLDRATQAASLSGTLDSLFCQKWKAILDLQETGCVHALLDFRSQAKHQGHWESVRFADLYLAQKNMPGVSADYLFYGTPYVEFRRRVRGEMPVSEEFFMNGLHERVLEISTGKIDGQSGFASGSANHRVLAALCEDFYRPANLTVLFDRVFPGEFYCPVNSRNRVHQAIWRARKRIEELRLPVELIAQEQNYRLLFHGPVSIRKTEKKHAEDRVEAFCEKIQRTFAEDVFTVHQATQLLGMGYSNCSKVIKKAISRGHVEKLGAGKNSCYRLVS